MAVAPVTAIPIPKPTIPCSHKGVLKTLSLPVLKKNPQNSFNTPALSGKYCPKNILLIKKSHAIKHTAA